MDLVKTIDHYVLQADLRGLTDEDVTVELQDNVLTGTRVRLTANLSSLEPSRDTRVADRR